MIISYIKPVCIHPKAGLAPFKLLQFNFNIQFQLLLFGKPSSPATGLGLPLLWSESTDFIVYRSTSSLSRLLDSEAPEAGAKALISAPQYQNSPRDHHALLNQLPIHLDNPVLLNMSGMNIANYFRLQATPVFSVEMGMKIYWSPRLMLSQQRAFRWVCRLLPTILPRELVSPVQLSATGHSLSGWKQHLRHSSCYQIYPLASSHNAISFFPF